MSRCRDGVLDLCVECVHRNDRFCCDGMDTPTSMPLGSCLHYERDVR